jgi:hypothetical protein
MHKLMRRGRKWIDRATGPALPHARTEAILAPTTERLQRALVPVAPSLAFDRELRASLNERARAMSAHTAWYRTRGALAGAAAVGLAVSVAGIATVVAMRRRQDTLAQAARVNA